MSGDPQPTSSAPHGDHDAPRIGTRTAPAWILLLCGAVFFSAQLYTDTFSGSFRADVYDAGSKEPPQIAAEDPAKVLGKKTYGIYCMVCHQPTGMGAAGQFPPLAGSDWVAAGPNRIIRIALDGATGPIKVSGQDFNNTMVPWREVLKDEEIAAVLTYVRSEWGNKAPPVKPEQVKAIRDGTKDHSGPWAPADLLSIPDSN
jgi:mono/diheme cytochrome c family protein